ncbi:MAG: hypothetical protein JXR96_25615 [Deltaproteobacteria bacterium]|nr:hypothetical protein [Deltaproteobacteria bacterium]
MTDPSPSPSASAALIIACLCFAAAAPAETYWVSPDGAASWESCAGPAPLDGAGACALETANARAAAGDTVYLRGGTYAGQTIEPDQSGSSDDMRIVFAARDGEDVVIRDSAYGIYIYKKSYISVDGIEFRSPRRFMRIYAGHFNTISHCTFDQRSPDSGDWAGAIIADDFADDSSASEDSTHNRVHHCRFYRWVYGAWDEHRGALLNIGNDQSAGDDSSYNLVEDNVFAYGGHHTLGVYSRFNVIRNNIIHNETNPEGWDYEGYRGAITEGPSAGRCLYTGNRFGFSLGSGIALRSAHNIFRFNSFFENGSGGIQVVTNAVGSDAADDNHIYHNAFFHNGHEADYSGFQGGMYFSSWSGVSPVGNVVKNNIFYANRNGSVTYDGAVDPQEIANNWDQNDVDPGFADLSGDDPEDASRPDLHLQPDSPARDMGTWLTTVTSPSGSGTTFAVADADYFTDGWGVVEGDLVRLAGSSQTARITAVDYQARTLTLDRSLAFETGQGIALDYHGDAPDLGAFELPDGELPDAGNDAGQDGGLDAGIDAGPDGEPGDGGADLTDSGAPDDGDGGTPDAPSDASSGPVAGGCGCGPGSRGGAVGLVLLIACGLLSPRQRSRLPA